MQVTQPLRFALIGCGVIGPTHADAITSQPDARLVAVVDADRDRAAVMAARYDVSAYAGVDEMLGAAHPDVVSICTPSGLHTAQACQVMRAGCHALVEKPMALNRADLDEMLAVQRDSGVQLAVISQHRFDPASQRVHELIGAGRFGR